MASSVFIGIQGFSNNGTQIVFSLPGAFPDGLVGAPSITFANELTSGLYRQGAGNLRFTIAGADVINISNGLLSVLTSGGQIQVPSNASFSWAGTGFLTAGGSTGTFLWRNVALTAGIGLDVNTDAVLKVRATSLAAYATVDCLGLKASGVAGATFGPSVLTSITIVNGIVTAAS